MRPSCRLAITCSTLSLRAEKIWLVSRILRPRWAILRETSPTSSAGESSAGSISVSPALALSRLAAILLRGPSATFEITADNTSEQKMATTQKNAACCRRGVSSLRRKTVETPTRTLPKGCPLSCNGILTSYTVPGLYSMRNWRRKPASRKTMRSRRGGIGLPFSAGLVSRMAVPNGSTIAAS